MDEEVFPVCSPKLLKGAHPLRKPEDLRHHTLIRDTYPIDWAAWLSSAKVKGVSPHKGLTFDSYTFALEAAVQGEGVVLGRTMLVAADLAAGRPVRPFKHTLQAVSSVFVVYPPEAIRQRKVRVFRDWLFSEINQQRAVSSS